MELSDRDLDRIVDRLVARESERLQPLSREEVERMTGNAASIATKNILTMFGFDTDKPLEVQQDVQFLRRMRMGSERVKDTTVKTLIGVLVSGLLAALFLGLRKG